MQAGARRRERRPLRLLRDEDRPGERLEHRAGRGGKTLRYDSPKCALSAWRQQNLAVESSRFQEFYTRTPTDASKLVFARGGDVIGPMGADLVPLDPASASRFLHDHGAKDTLKLDAITAELLRTI